MPTPDERRKKAIRGAERFLNAWHGVPTAAEQLRRIADATAPDERRDLYGAGERLERLEQRVAKLLGKPAAVFMPSGTMAQQIAVRIWCDRKGVPTVAFHPTCHLELHEEHAYARLHGLQRRLVGDPNALIRLEDLEAIHEPVGALLLELPQREIGGRLPTWSDLVAQTTWARDRGIALHLDGARLWEAQPFYRRTHARIAALFDSAYVSFYKGLGGMAGAALAADEETIAEARVWLRRHGGNLVTMHAYVVAAELGLDERLGRMGAYFRHARAIAVALATVDGVEVVPDPPQTPLFHVLLRGEHDRLVDAALFVAEDRKVFLFGEPSPTSSPSWQRHEVHVGESTLALSPDEVASLYAEVIERANRPAAPKRARKRS